MNSLVLWFSDWIMLKFLSYIRFHTVWIIQYEILTQLKVQMIFFKWEFTHENEGHKPLSDFASSCIILIGTVPINFKESWRSWGTPTWKFRLENKREKFSLFFTPRSETSESH